MNSSMNYKESKEYQKKVQELSYLLWKSDHNRHQPSKDYWYEAELKLSGFRWQLCRLNQPFIGLVRRLLDL